MSARRVLRIVSIAIALIVSSARANAQAERREAPTLAHFQPLPWETSPPEDQWDRKFEFLGHLAPLGSPSGISGLSIGYAPFRALQIDAAIGEGEQGPQLALDLRPRLVVDAANAISLFGGVSGGAYRQWYFAFDPTVGDCVSSDGCGKSTLPRTAHATWINFGATVEHRWPSHLVLAVSAGGSQLAHSTPATCDAGAGCGTLGSPLLFFVDAGVGLAF